MLFTPHRPASVMYMLLIFLLLHKNKILNFENLTQRTRSSFRHLKIFAKEKRAKIGNMRGSNFVRIYADIAKNKIVI